MQVPNGTEKPPIHTSSSNPNLVTHETERQRPASMPEQALAGHDVKIQEMKLREDFLDVAKTGEIYGLCLDSPPAEPDCWDVEVSERYSCRFPQSQSNNFSFFLFAVHDSLKGLSHTITTERERLKNTLQEEDGRLIQGNAAYIMSLKQTLAESMKQNQELRSRMSRIGDLAVMREPLPYAPETLSKVHSSGTLTRGDVSLARENWGFQHRFWGADLCRLTLTKDKL